MSAAVDIFGHIIGGLVLHATATTEVGCFAFARVPTGPVGPDRAAAAATGACLSCAEREMPAAVDIFGHMIGGRFLCAAATTVVGCLVFARVSSGPVGHARAAAAATGARLLCAECEMSAAVDIFGHIIGGRCLYAAATADVGCLVLLIPQFCPHRPGTVPGGTVLVELAIYWLNAAVNSCSARI